jgi:ech hydrogenase subunit D
VKEPAGKGPAEFLELHYSFDINYELTGYKIRISPDDEVPSITPVYPCAFLYENEMHDLFGVKVIGINIDFKGTLYKLATSRPFNPETEKPEAFRKKAE